jgi:hypothetical protein
LKPLKVKNRPKCPFCEDTNPESKGHVKNSKFHYRWLCLNKHCGLSFTTSHKVDILTGVEELEYVVQETTIDGYRTQINLTFEEYRGFMKKNYSLSKTQKMINSAIFYIERYSILFKNKKFDSIKNFKKK